MLSFFNLFLCSIFSRLSVFLSVLDFKTTLPMAKFAQKILTVITAIIETLLSSCIIYGWPAMDYILTKEGYFSTNCNSTSENQTLKQNLCTNQQYNLELIYTLSAVLSAFFGLIGGPIMDRYGTMIFRNFASFMFIASCIAIAFSNPQISWLLYPSMIILATSGWFLYITVLQTANLFPKFRGTIVNIINGALDASLGIFSLAKAVYEFGISLRAIFIFMAFIIGGFSILRTYFLMPKEFIPYDVPKDFCYGIAQNCSKVKSSFDGDSEERTHLLNQNVSENPENAEDTNNDDTRDKLLPSSPSVKSSILNSLFILGTFSMVIQWFRASFFIEALNAWLKYLIPHRAQLVSFDISLFGYVQFSAILCAPLNGLVFDFCFYCLSKKTNLTKTQAKLKSLTVVCVIGSMSSIIYSAFALIDNPYLQYASFVLYVFGDTFPEANISLLLIQIFPMTQFGTLYGLVSCFIGAATAMQFPFFYIAMHYFKGNFLVVNVLALCLVIFTLAHPVNLYRKSKKSDEATSS